MSRPLRIEYPGAWYHVMNRGRRKENIFLTRQDYEVFIRLLQETSESWNLQISAYCLMSNHYHLLVHTPDGNISRCMRHINGVYTQRFNRNHATDGQLFRGRYKAVLVEEDRHILEVLRYIHRNPLRAGVVKDLGDFSWSSHHGYLSSAKKWEWLNKIALQSMISERKNRYKQAYLDYVSSRDSEKIECFYSLKNLPSVLGGNSFKEWIKDTFGHLRFNKEITAIQVLSPSPESIIALVCKYYKIEETQVLTSRRGRENLPRDIAIYLVRHHSRMTLSNIGKHFGINNYSTVSSAVERINLRTQEDFGVKQDLKNIGGELLKPKADLTPWERFVVENPRILVVDDSSSVCELYKELLDVLGANTDMARDGQEALDKARVNAYDLIITDVDMPRMDGINLCDTLRADPTTCDIPVIIASTFDSDQDIEKGFKAGASAYLSKKEVRSLLIKTVKEVLWKSKHVRQRKILVVDDSRSILNLVEEGLVRNGFQTVSASNGKIALDIIAVEEPDLILSDINMPEVDGFELCKRVKMDPKLASIPFVVMSTNDNKIHMDRMIQYGAAAYLVKPFNFDQLVVLIEKILSDHFLLLLKERKRLDYERESLLDSITSLVSALEARDTYTRGHSEAVSVITSEMVALTGASQIDIETVAMAGRLHDIGKIGVRDSVLLKPGKLTDEEFDHIKKHSAIGMTILSSIPSLAEILPVVHFHHERWDGKGYPMGLRKKQTPFWARIAAVADTFHALTSDRPYRKGMDYSQAFEIMETVRETQLCPECVDLFFYWITSKGDIEELY